MARKTIAERKAKKMEQLKQLKDEVSRLEELTSQRLGRLALKAGLGDASLDDAALLAEFESVASRFRRNQVDPPAQGQNTCPEGGALNRAL